jgi:hypothetical protein
MRRMHSRDDPGDVLDDRLAVAIALLNMAVVRDVARHRCIHGVPYAGPWRRRMGSYDSSPTASNVAGRSVGCGGRAMK